MAPPCVEYLVRNPKNRVTVGEYDMLKSLDELIVICVACRTLSSAQKLAAGFPRTNAISLDVSSMTDLDKQVGAHDLVISLIPYIYHAAVIKSAIKRSPLMILWLHQSHTMS